MDYNTSQALKFGLSFYINVNLNPVDISKGFINLERFSNLELSEINIGKGLVYSCLDNESYSNFPKRFHDSVIKLKRNKNIHVTKSDKSNSFVILDKQQYVNKMYDLLSDDTTYTLLNQNPLNKVNSDFNRNLRRIFSNSEHKELINKFQCRMSTLPYMYGLVKTHKENFPMRPIISTVGSASYKLSKYLVNILSPIVGTISNSHIKNNVDLIEKLNCNIPNYNFKLISFDVKSLFTKVPIDDLLNYLETELNNRIETLPLSPHCIIELIKLCVIDSKFTFNGKFYQQKFGLSMGNPLSPVLSNIYMEFFEVNLLSTIKDVNVIWYRYIDDVLCLWPINDNLNNFFNNLNNLVESIKFTFEIEINNILPFLDVLIHRVECSGFKFSVYRKPTSNNSFIHFYSGHNDIVKRSVFISMFLRALRVCSPEYFNKEIKTIYEIGNNLKYSECFLDICFSKARKSFYNINNNIPRKFENVLVLPYNENLVKIKSLLKCLNINLIFSFGNVIKNILIKNSPNSTQPCIYKIPCNNCDSFYIGQTSKTLDLRIKQHKYNVRTAQTSSGIFCHHLNFNHCVSWNNSSELLFINDFHIRNLIESIIIKITFENNMNLSLGLYNADPIIQNMLIKWFKLAEKLNS